MEYCPIFALFCKLKNYFKVKNFKLCKYCMSAKGKGKVKYSMTKQCNLFFL